MTEPPAWADMVLVGRVARVHGLRGQVIVNPETDFPAERFEPGRVVYRQAAGGVEALRVVTCRTHRGRPIVGFEGRDVIEQAELLVGDELRVPAEWLAPLPEHTYYVHDLVGCRVHLADGRPLGSVERVEGDGGASRLVVAADAGEVLIPLAAAICRRVDVGARLVVVDPPEGLVELNRTRPRARLRSKRRVWR